MDISKIDLRLRDCDPLFPYLTGHSQTILAHLIPSITKNYEYVYEKLKLSDGDQLSFKFVDRKAPFTLIVFHGLAGDSDADYMRRSADVACEFGWNVVLVNHRGADAGIKNKKTYHSGRGDDASAVVAWARKRFAGTVVALGFSMSGSILLNLLCGRKGTEKPEVGIVVNAPLELHDAALRLTKGMTKIYDWRFFFILKKLIRENGHDLALPMWGHTIDIDEVYTSKLNGFSDAADYYKNCSVYKYLEQVDRPTFVLTAEDDPFINVNFYKNAKWNKNINLNLQRFGGHMGYLEWKKDLKVVNRWLDDYLRSVFRTISTGL